MFKKFWKTGKEKRLEFLDKLKGTSSFEVSKNAPIGAIFIVTNQNTGEVDSYICVNDNRWTVCGTGPVIRNKLVNTFTTRQLEMHLSKLARGSDANSIHIIDQGWIKPS